MSWRPDSARPTPYPRPMASTGLRSPDRPLAARSDPARSDRVEARRTPRGQPQHRLRTFVQLYGWRAYAVPVLTVVTFVTLLDVSAAGSADRPAPVSDAASAGAATTADQSLAAASPTAEFEGVDPTATFSPEAAPVTFVQRGTGNLLVVPGSSAVLGTGPLRRFQVQVEDGINVDAPAFAKAVEQTLGDPRSWGAGGQLSFQRVDTGDYDFRVALVSPDNVESFCPGYGTQGYTSCRYQDRAVINLARWETAVPDYQGDIPTYRQYVVNHEVGHYLGHGHESCPGPGELAPVMQQQTLGLDGCLKNPWPYPQG